MLKNGDEIPVFSEKEGESPTKHLFSSALCGLPKIDANRYLQLKKNKKLCMDINELVELLGHSHKNKVTNKKLKELGFEVLSPSDNYSGVPFLVDYRHSELDIKLTFNGYNYYNRAYGEPKNYTEKQVKELILQTIHINFKDIKLKFQEEFIFPLGISFLYKKDDIFELLRSNYNTIVKFIEDDFLSFSYEDYFVAIAFQDTSRMKDIYLTLKGVDEKIREKLELELELQKLNIKSTNTKELFKILDPTPDLDWDYQIEWGSKKSKKNITEIFKNLKEILIQHTQNSNPNGIYQSVKTSILKLNEFQNSGFIIDTQEREKLCFSIDNLLKATGFYTYGIDITSKWRAW